MAELAEFHTPVFKLLRANPIDMNFGKISNIWTTVFLGDLPNEPDFHRYFNLKLNDIAILR